MSLSADISYNPKAEPTDAITRAISTVTRVQSEFGAVSAGVRDPQLHYDIENDLFGCTTNATRQPETTSSDKFLD